MPYDATVYRVLIASPSDVKQERKVMPQVIYDWNSLNSKAMSVVLLPVMWETHSTPEIGDRPQAIINRQVVRDCDILVGAFWTRIGTYTGVSESGTVEEIREFVSADRPVLLYFSSVPISMDKVDLSQYGRLMAFKEELKGKGLISEYSDTGELQEQMSRHLTIKMRDILSGIPEIGNEHAPTKSQDLSLVIVRRQLDAFVRKVETLWSVERDSQPFKLDEAKAILIQQLGRGLAEPRFLLEKCGVDERILQEMDKIMIAAKKIREHRVFLDGGKSYRHFWEIGDDLVSRAKEIVSRIS